jgi:hypothetical protein
VKLKSILAAGIAAAFSNPASAIPAHALNDSTPTLSDLSRYRVNQANQAEAIRQALYDFVLYPTAGQTQLLFFQNQNGAGSGVSGTTASGAVAGTAKSLSDTNMELAANLPRFKNFLAESIEVRIDPGSVATANTFTLANIGAFTAAAASAGFNVSNDVNALQQTGWLEFFIGSKLYLQEAPLGRFPPKCRMEVDAACAYATTVAATNSMLVVNVARAGGRPYYLNPRVVLTDSQNFVVRLNWPVAVATPSGFNARVGVLLDGFVFRASQ